MATIRVHTAQNVTLEYEVASLGDRILAAIIDNVVLGAWVIAWLMVLGMFNTGRDGSVRGVALYVLLFMLGFSVVFYHLVCEVFFNGQSIGKKAMDIRVMRLDGTAPRQGDYLLRWLLRIIDTVFLGGVVAIVAIAASGRGQRLGDMAAGTTVLKVRPQASPSTLFGSVSLLEGYQVVFPQAALLADHDVALVRRLLHQGQVRHNYELINEVANKVKAITGIRTELQDEPFLQTILRDHAHLASNG
jgi:uncharacterized RDD family membrane protein YckC